MIKVILVAPQSGITGGIRNWARNVCSYQSSLTDKNVELIPFDFARKTAGQLQTNLVSRVFNCLREYSSLTAKAIKFIKESDADAVHITTPASFLLVKDLLLIRATHRSGKKAVVHFHFGRIPEVVKSSGAERYLLNAVLRSADRAIVMDRLSLETLKKKGYENVVYIPNPVSDTVFKIIDAEHVAPVPDTVFFAGHVIRTKGVEELISACKEMQGVHLKIAGAVSEKYKSYLSALAGEDSGKWIEICGELDYPSVIREMQGNSVFVLPSYTEGFPNVILEAMACGCAIVATSVGAIPQMLDADTPEKECGLVVAPGNADQLRSAIEKVLSEPELAARCRANARKRLVENYTMPRVWAQLLEAWMSVGKNA